MKLYSEDAPVLVGFLHEIQHCVSPLSEILKTMIYRPGILYGCGMWSLTLSEEHELRVSAYQTFQKMYGCNHAI
jgi:hypothetical protein